MVKLEARILVSNSIAHGYTTKSIYVNKNNISSIVPNNNGFFTLTMISGETYEIDMQWSSITKAMEE